MDQGFLKRVDKCFYNFRRKLPIDSKSVNNKGKSCKFDYSKENS